MESRPEITIGLDSRTFREYYCLKEELAAFCRDHHLPAKNAFHPPIDCVPLPCGIILCPIKQTEDDSMKKPYGKNELAFALACIAVCVAGTSLAEALSETAGTYKLVSAVFHIALTAGLFLWVMRNGLAEKYGLFLPRYRLWKQYELNRDAFHFEWIRRHSGFAGVQR